MKSYEHLDVDKRDGYCIITISKKPANALTIKVCLDLADLIDELNVDDDVRAIIITGGIKFSFFTGSDLDEIYSIMNEPGDPAENMMRASRPVQEAFTRIADSPKVTIAAINGVTIGLGVELALACDMRIISELAWFRLAQVGIGIIPGAGGTQRLPELVGVAKAKELIFTSRKVKAEEAEQMGLVNRVVPYGDELKAAIVLANEITKQPSYALSLAKKAIQQQSALPLQARLDREMELLGESYHSNEAFEGIEAVMEKRTAVFNKKRIKRGDR